MLLCQNIVQLSPLLRSMLKLHLLSKMDDLPCPLGLHSHMDFWIHDIESTRGFESALDMTCLLTRHNKNFIRRRKFLPLDMIKHLMIYEKREDKKIWRVWVDEDRSLAKNCEFNKLLLKNDTTMEATARHAQKLNAIIERPNQDYHSKSRIAMGLTKVLPIDVWCFGQEHASLIKHRTW